VEKNIHFMLINAPDCATCLFSWYGLLITLGGVCRDFSETGTPYDVTDSNQ